MFPLMDALIRRFTAGLACLLLSACASLSFERDTQSSGTFRSAGWSFTLFSVDLPKSALNIARENASDANMPHLVVEQVVVMPYLGPLDFLMDILSIRYARISGTWGFAGD